MGVIGALLKRIERTINSRQAYKFFIRDWQSLTDLPTCARIVSTMRFSRTLEPLEMTAPLGRRITVVAPHPDDEMLGAGGTLIRARSHGAAIRCIYVTSSRPPERVEAETVQVAQRVGYSTDFLRYPLDGIPLNEESIARLAAAVAAQPTDCLFVPVLFDDNDDHRRTNQLLWQAWERGLINGDLEIWCYQVYSPVIANVVVDISDIAEQKRAAVKMWHSQMEIRKFDHYILGLNAFNIRLLPKAWYVEAFFVVPMREYGELCKTYFSDPQTAFYNPAYRTPAS